MTETLVVEEAITQAERQDTLLKLGKLLLDEDRLKILGLLAQQPCSAETLARQLAMERVKVHLNKLEEFALIDKCVVQGAELYQLDHKQLLQLKKRLFARTAENRPLSTAEKELAKFIKHERLVQLPVHPTKLRNVLAWLADKFQPGVMYAEKQVNDLLQGHAIDHVTLRRLLIDHGLLVRQAGIYQRVVSADA
jgi:hypothetical protein